MTTRTWAYIATFFVVFAARLIVVLLYGVDTPYWDEWDAGAANLYAPFASGQLTLDALLAPHNEHRILTSRLIGLAAFVLVGWHPILLMCISGAIWAALAAWLVHALGPLAGPRWPWLAAFTATLFALPIGYDNALLGMNAHFYLLIAFSLVALHDFGQADALSWRWWRGAVFATLAYFSMASGAFTPLVAVIVIALQMISGQRRAHPAEIASIALLLLGGAAALYFTPRGVSDLHQAHSLWKVLWALILMASLPLPAGGLLIVQAPLVINLWRTVRDRLPRDRAEWFVTAAAGWIAAQMIAIAYSRALQPLAPRYFDFFVLVGPIGCAVALGATSRWWLMAGRAWTFLVGLAFAYYAVAVVMQLPQEAAIRRAGGDLLAAYLETGDRGVFDDAPPEHLVYPSTDRLVGLLADPAIRAILPTGLNQ
jgi:hypothetical protein